MISNEQKTKCFSESMRVLKKVGLLVIAYIPGQYLNQILVTTDSRYIDKTLLNQIKHTGVLRSDNPKCFWTDTYYSSYDEMQELYKDNELDIVKHFAQDGMAPLFHNNMDSWNEEQFDTWYKYHLFVCEEKSIIDMSNHVVIIGRKN